MFLKKRRDISGNKIWNWLKEEIDKSEELIYLRSMYLKLIDKRIESLLKKKKKIWVFFTFLDSSSFFFHSSIQSEKNLKTLEDI